MADEFAGFAPAPNSAPRSSGPPQADDEFSGFASADHGGAAPPSPVYDAALFKQRVGREPEPAELANFQAMKGAGWAGDPGQASMPLAQVAATAVPAAAEVGLTGGTAAALAPFAAARYALYLAQGNGHEYAKARANDLLQYVYQPKTDLGRATLGTVQQVAGEAPVQTYQAAAYNTSNFLRTALGLPTDPEASGQFAR